MLPVKDFHSRRIGSVNSKNCFGSSLRKLSVNLLKFFTSQIVCQLSSHVSRLIIKEYYNFDVNWVQFTDHENKCTFFILGHSS